MQSPQIVFVSVMSVGLLILPHLGGVSAQTTLESQRAKTWGQSAQTADYSQARLPFATDHIIVKTRAGEVMNVPIESAEIIADAISAWSSNPNVEYAELDGLAHTLAQTTSWGWTTVRAGDAATTNAATGAGAIIAVVDTGVDYNHEDLDANNFEDTGDTAADNLDNDSNGFVDDRFGYDFIGSIYTSVAPDEDPQDENGHGTHVAGIIAAENNLLGVRGVAPSATIMPVKVLDASGWGWDSTIADGIRYAADQGADVINLSLGTSFASHTLSDAIDYAFSQGVVIVAAAGNEGTFTGSAFPAQYANVISVGASTEEGYKAYFSNWGKVDVVAPGVDILSTYPGNKYELLSGTSMASPHVAGVLGLIRQDSGISNDPRALRHILETSSADFGTQTGPDYVAGYGMVDALTATGVQTTEAFLYADQGWVRTDATDTATITISVRNAAGTAVAADAVTWTSTLGTLSAAAGTTDANGEASVTLTADDAEGLAVITADAASAEAVTMQMALVPDTVKPETIGLSAFNVTEEDTEIVDDELEIGGADPASASSNVFSAGDEVIIWSYLSGSDREEHEVTLSYSVTDPNGTAVADLSGTTPSADVGIDFYGYFYLPQTRVSSKPLTIPDDAVAGEYTLTVTATDSNSSETASRSETFWVGELPEVLVVYDSGYCSDTPVQGWDFGGVGVCSRVGHDLKAEVEALGYDVMLWDTTDIGSPLDTDLVLFPVVIWADAGLVSSDSFAMQSYLDQGGNLLLTAEVTASYEGYTLPSEFLWDYLHARFVSELIHPDQVNGVSGGMFDGLTFNTDYYNLNGDGTHTSFYADELEINTADDALAVFSFDEGNSTDKIAGVRADTGTYRMAFLSFGLESINDGTGNATKGYVLNTLLTWLLGDGPSVDSVSPAKLKNNKDRSLTIQGSGFSLTGETEVQIAGEVMSDVVVTSREEIAVTVPAGLAPDQYNVKVTNPDGSTDTLTDGVQVTAGGPIISAITQGFASNNIKHKIEVTGYNFKHGAKVYLDGERVSAVTVYNPNQLTFTVPQDFLAGTYRLKVKNPSKKSDTMYSAVKVRVGFTETLLAGDVHAQVKALENRLEDYGFFSDTPDATFDEVTENALLRYQNSVGIEESGYVDFLTRYHLNNNE